MCVKYVGIMQIIHQPAFYSNNYYYHNSAKPWHRQFGNSAIFKWQSRNPGNLAIQQSWQSNLAIQAIIIFSRDRESSTKAERNSVIDIPINK